MRTLFLILFAAVDCFAQSNPCAFDPINDKVIDYDAISFHSHKSDWVITENDTTCYLIDLIYIDFGNNTSAISVTRKNMCEGDFYCISEYLLNSMFDQPGNCLASVIYFSFDPFDRLEISTNVWFDDSGLQDCLKEAITKL